jgi:Uma2 family endonuclease
MVAIAVPVDQRMVLSNISWETYERLLADYVDQSSPRFAYDQGTLEIMSPGRDHERDNRALSSIVWTVAIEHDIDFDDVGSMTYKRARLDRGFEADSTFYLLPLGRRARQSP